MKKVLITAVPPAEIKTILLKSGAGVRIGVKDAEPFYGMPRWEIAIEGTEEEIERFIHFLMRSRAGG